MNYKKNFDSSFESKMLVGVMLSHTAELDFSGEIIALHQGHINGGFDFEINRSNRIFLTASKTDGGVAVVAESSDTIFSGPCTNQRSKWDSRRRAAPLHDSSWQQTKQRKSKPGGGGGAFHSINIGHDIQQNDFFTWNHLKEIVFLPRIVT